MEKICIFYAFTHAVFRNDDYYCAINLMAIDCYNMLNCIVYLKALANN